MRKLLCGLSCVLCIGCATVALGEFFAKFDTPREATFAMAFWVAWGWVFALINYATLPPGKPPPIDVVGKWRQLCKAVRELASFAPPQREFGIYFWLVIILIFAFALSLISPAVQNARRASEYVAAFPGDSRLF